jgi:allantoicase
MPDPRDIWGMPLDLAGLEFGGLVVDCSDMYFSHRHNLNQPTTPASVADGWETRRRRGPGNDWVVVRLADEGTVRIAEIDTRFFKGNAPGSFSLDGRAGDGDWAPLLEPTDLRPHLRHRFRVPHHAPVTHVRLNIYPDGGVARLRLWGSLSQRGAEDLGLRWLASLTPQQAEAELYAVCAAPSWAAEVAAGRPFATLADLREASNAAWDRLDRDARLAAFAAHPRIGTTTQASDWSRAEQSASASPTPDTAQALAEGNAAYEERFGHVFLVSADGLRAEEVLARLRERLGNDPDAELANASAEQQKIIDLRLARLVTP